MINTKRHFFFGLFLLSVFLAEASFVDNFSKLSTYEARIEYLDIYNIVNVNQVSKEEYFELLPIIKRLEDPRVEFYFYYQLSRLLYYFQVDDENQADSYVKMLEIVETNSLEIEKVVFQFMNAFRLFAMRKLSEQDLFYEYSQIYDKIKYHGAVNFKYYAYDWMLNEIGRNFYELLVYDKALECLLSAEKLSKKDSQIGRAHV